MSDEVTSLQGILTGEEPEKVEVAPEPEEVKAEEEPKEPETPEPEEEPEKGEKEPETPEPEEPPSSEKDPITGLQAALAAERQKRQDLERRLNEKPEEKVDFYEDPNKALEQSEQRTGAMLNKSILAISENAARARYTDFDDKIELFAQMAASNQVYAQNMMNSLDPAEYAYQAATQQKLIDEIGNPAQYEQKVRADIEATLRKEFDEKLKAEITKLAVPKSPTEAQGDGQSYTKQGKTVEMTSLDDIVG